MKKTTRRWAMVRLLLAFFAGVLLTVYLLVPGRSGPTVLVCGDERLQIQQLDRAGERLAQAGSHVWGYVGQAGDHLRSQVSSQAVPY